MHEILDVGRCTFLPMACKTLFKDNKDYVIENFKGSEEF